MQCQSRIFADVLFFRTGEDSPKGRRGFNIPLSKNGKNKKLFSPNTPPNGDILMKNKKGTLPADALRTFRT